MGHIEISKIENMFEAIIASIFLDDRAFVLLRKLPKKTLAASLNVRDGDGERDVGGLWTVDSTFYIFSNL